jgi:hypothetical protein
VFVCLFVHLLVFSVEEEESHYMPIDELLSLRVNEPTTYTVEEDDDDEADAYRSRNPKAKQAVEQIDLVTGQVLRRYPSQGTAMQVMQGTQALISACCRGLRDSAYGFGWRPYIGPPINCEPRVHLF